MRFLPAATLLLAALPASAAALEPLVEMGHVPFEPPFEDGGSGERSVRFHPEAPVAYAVSGDHLFAFDARTGDDLGRISLASAAGDPGYGGWELTFLGGRLLAWSYSVDGLAVLDVSDPAAPKLLDAGTWESPRLIGAFDEGFFALLHDDGFDLLAAEPFRVIAEIPHALPYGQFYWAFASAAKGAAPVLAAVEKSFAGPRRQVLSVYDAAGGVPVLRFSHEESASVGSVLLDRAGEVLVATFDGYDPVHRTWIETIDARTGATLASWDVAPHLRGTLAEGSGRQLLLADATGIDVVDLEDPADPRPIGRVEIGPPVSSSDSRAVAPSSGEPIVFVADPVAREVLVLDPRTATEIARLAVESGVPVGVALQEVPGGTRRGALIVRHGDWTRSYFRGGLSRLDLADLSDPAAPRATGRFLRNQPGRVDAVEAIGGRHVVAYEIRRNALALVGLAEGRIAQVTGASAVLGEFEMYDAPELRTAGRFVLLSGPGGWERFALVRGRLEPLDSRIPPPEAWEGIEAAELTPKGTVIALGWRYDDGEWVYDLETTGIDGRTGRIPRVYARLLRPVASPVGELVVVARPEYWGEERGLDVYDVSDPSSPALVWTLPGDVSDAVFDPTGTRVLVSGPLWDLAYQVRVFDARTGAPLGPPSSDIAKYDYHGFGAQWIVDGAWRAIYWRWSWCGWENALVDLSGAAPEHVRTYTYDGSFPEFAPRDVGGWYEARRDPWNELAVLVVGSPEGEAAETAVIPGDHSEITAVRRGFLTTARELNGEWGISLWRDPALVPAPVPVRRGTAGFGASVLDTRERVERAGD
jgi:hypothetical protein